MKHLYILFAIVLLFSCGTDKGQEQNQYGSISFSLDTVMVDAGNEIINLKNGIWLSTLSNDKKLFYNFDQDQTTVEKIDLDGLVLAEKIPFEKEGPNGTGQFVSSVQMDRGNNLMISTWGEMGVFNLQGEKLRQFNIKDFENFSSDFLISEDNNSLVGIIRSWTEKGLELGVLDYEGKNLKKYTLEDFDRTQDYHVMMRSGNAVQISGQAVKIQEHQGKYLISNSIFNTLALYDPVADSVSYIKYDNKLTENSKTGKYRNEVESRETFHKEITLINQEISFQAPMWDEKKEVFYRFSYKQKPESPDADPDTPRKYDVFLTILDGSFNVLGESKVDVLSKTPSSSFVKDGKVWIYENVDDELGFVRLEVIS
ncbi:DUF4221 family protein [Litoribacter populi]|uniref:DUF4221 family protein n=1 Tax=Litoribacter populi TaxID=2598460 RepID=UPI001180B93D|nr:DUF4221 family protein [Litoribacter populi]